MKTKSVVHKEWVRLSLMVMFAAIYLLNNFLPSIDLQTFSWHVIDLMPVKLPILGDFYHDYFFGARFLHTGDFHFYDKANYHPPFMELVYLPLALFSYKTACILFLSLCLLATFASMGLSLQIFKTTFKVSEHGQLELVGILVFFYLISSYGFALSLGRGNNESFTLALTLLALYLLIRRPKLLWPPIVLLSMAANLKVYPLIFLPLCFIRHGKRAIIPVIVSNVLFACSLGFENLSQFLTWISRANISARNQWIGNHSAASFSSNILVPLGFDFTIGKIFSQVLPVLIGVLAWWRLQITSDQTTRLIWTYVIVLPIALLVPSISHDYKLILLFPAIVLLTTIYANRLIDDHLGENLVKMAILWLLLLFMHRGPLYAFNLPWVAHKYLYIICIQLLLLTEVLRLKVESRIIHR